MVSSSIFYIFITCSNEFLALPEGEARKKAAVFTPSLAKIWNEMTAEQKLAATDDGVEELQELREMKELSKQNIPLHAFNDARATLESVANTVCFLYNQSFSQLTI